ncbi:hypothetical protein PENSPDRAFT_650430 [Peniophora sp. CONT]|nr:hypothetical protein PENSPDRAFT_650430 [Peniophora sp. CONT]
MPAVPMDIHSITGWAAALIATKTCNPRIPMVAKFYAPWCNSNNEMAPFYLSLAEQEPHVQFLNVNVADPEAYAVGALYQVDYDSLPTFVGTYDGVSFHKVQGKNRRAVANMVDELKKAAWKMPPEAEQDKADGNKAFAEKEYKSAIAHYSAAITKAPRTAVLYSNRAISYLKLSEEDAASAEHPDSEWHPKRCRGKAFGDACSVIDLDVRWGKAWVRYAQAMIAGQQDVLDADMAPELKAERVRFVRDGAIAMLGQAAIMSEGKFRAEAEALQRALLDGA